MKKKLLVDAHTFDENHQGIRTFLKGIYNVINFNSNDVEVILVANNIKNLKQEFKHQKKFKYIQLKHTNKYIRLAYEIPKIIKSLDIDFAHFNYYLPLFLSKKCIYIVTIHDILFIDFPQYFPKKYQVINTFLFKRSAKKAQILTTVSEYSKQRLYKHFSIKDKNISILSNAVDSVFTKSHNKEIDKLWIKEKFGIEKYILFVSRLEPRKNHITLLKAFKELKLWEKGYALVFIGKESFKNKALEVEIEAVSQISKDILHHLDNITHQELVRFYNAADLAIFPSLCEGFGIPPIESAVLETPTLCSNVTAMKDFDFFGDCLFNPTSKDQLKSKITEYLNSNLMIDTDDISKQIQDRYAWQKSAMKLSQLIVDYKT